MVYVELVLVFVAYLEGSGMICGMQPLNDDLSLPLLSQSVRAPRDLAVAVAQLVLSRRWGVNTSVISVGDKVFLAASKGGKRVCFLVSARHHANDSYSQKITPELQQAVIDFAANIGHVPGYAVIGLEDNLQCAHLFLIEHDVFVAEAEANRGPKAHVFKGGDKGVLRVTYSSRVRDELKELDCADYVAISLEKSSRISVIFN